NAEGAESTALKSKIYKQVAFARTPPRRGSFDKPQPARIPALGRSRYRPRKTYKQAGCISPDDWEDLEDLQRCCLSDGRGGVRTGDLRENLQDWGWGLRSWQVKAVGWSDSLVSDDSGPLSLWERVRVRGTCQSPSPLLRKHP